MKRLHNELQTFSVLLVDDNNRRGGDGRSPFQLAGIVRSMFTSTWDLFAPAVFVDVAPAARDVTMTIWLGAYCSR